MTPRYTTAPFQGNAEWHRHWLLDGDATLAYLDTHPASGLDAVKVSNLYVPPEHRGHDYGRQLIKLAMMQHLDRDVVITPAPWQDRNVPKESLERIYASVGFRKMAGERYKDLMIFQRSFAFKLGVKAAGFAKPSGAPLVSPMPAMSRQQQKPLVAAGTAGKAGNNLVSPMPAMSRQQQKPLVAPGTAGKVGNSLMSKLPPMQKPRSAAEVKGLGASGGTSASRVMTGAASAPKGVSGGASKPSGGRGSFGG